MYVFCALGVDIEFNQDIGLIYELNEKINYIVFF